MVKEKDFNLSHNHTLRPPVQIEGVTRITRECELNTIEKEWMQEIGPFVDSGRSGQIVTMTVTYFIIAKGKSRLGSDADSFNAFISKGRELASNGGIFDQVFDEIGRLTEIYLQWPLMVQFAKKYGDFTIVDGTFKITAYDLMLIVFTNVDSLGNRVYVDTVPLVIVGSLPPSWRRLNNGDADTNLSALVRPTQKRTKTCRHCILVNRPEDAKGHQTGGNCPNKNLLVPGGTLP